MSSDAKKTLVEEGTQFKGSLSSKCPVEVRGRVEGEVTAPSLTVSTSGAVQGKVKVDELTSDGEIAGEFDATNVRLSGVVKDNTVLRAKSLSVKLSSEKGKMQVMFGECALEVGEMPTREASVEKPAEKAAGKGAKSDVKAEASMPPPKADASIPPPPKAGASVPPPGGE